MSDLHQSRSLYEDGEAYLGITGMLLDAAQNHPEAGASVVSDIAEHGSQFIPYPELLVQARRILGGLRSGAATQGQRIALLLESPSDFIPTFWACIMGGYVPCPLAPVRNDQKRWQSHLSHVDHLLDGPLFVSASDEIDGLPHSTKHANLSSLRSGRASEYLHRPGESDTAILMLTSGSTGNSKAVALSHGNLLASMSGKASRLGLTFKDTAFNWIAFDHVAALLESHLIATYVGAGQLHVEPPVVLADPLRFLSLIHQYRVSLAFAPNFLLGKIVSCVDSSSADGSTNAPELDLSCLRRIVTGGEANLVETGTRFIESLKQFKLSPDVLWPAFGMTETCAACVYSDNFPEQDLGSEFAAVGLPIDGLELRITGERGRGLRTEGPGELQLRGPMIFGRYYNNSEATKEAFTDDGWFRTGDIGHTTDGWLRLIARSKDSIIVNGVNYFSHEIESRLEKLDGIDSSFVAAFPTRPKGANTEQLVVAFATILPATDEEGIYRQLVAIRNTTIMFWGFRPERVLLLPKTAFPKTSLGKIQRSLMRRRFENGEYAPQESYISSLVQTQSGDFCKPDGPTEQAIAGLFAKVLDVDPGSISTNKSFFDLGGTSYDILKLTRALEQNFGIKGGLPMVLQSPSIQQLALRVSAPKGSVRRYDPIVPLQITGKKTPLFCIHPGNGEILTLVNVAKYFLNDRPFYAIRARGFNPGEECFQSFEELRDTYVDAILQKQPRGPYAIAGYSFGCSIAFEIAKVFESRGLQVAFLGCIDGEPTAEGQSLGFNLAAGLALVTDLITLDVCEKLNSQLGPEEPSIDTSRHVLEFASPERLAELNIDLERFSTWAKVAHSVESILYAHAASGRVREMTIFRSEGHSPRYVPEMSSTERWRAELQRWDQFVLKPRHIDVPGQHFTCMGPNYVSDFQARLREEIDRSLKLYGVE